jgi:hypothetical protein
MPPLGMQPLPQALVFEGQLPALPGGAAPLHAMTSATRGTAVARIRRSKGISEV